MSKKLLQNIDPEEYKKKLGYNFTAFEVNMREVDHVDKMIIKQFEFTNSYSAEQYMPRKSMVKYKGRKCMTIYPPVMTGSDHKHRQRWMVQLVLITNNPNNFIPV